jgi:hypothetical protein
MIFFFFLFSKIVAQLLVDQFSQSNIVSWNILFLRPIITNLACVV